MIRPFTCVCLLLAAGSGLYLYQTKHQTQMVDRNIERTLKAADAAWQRASVLRAEYTLLNDPSRLADLAGQYLPALQTTTPGQFSTEADLDHRLPAVGAAPPQPAPLEPATPTPLSQPEAAKPEPLRPELPRPELPRAEPTRAVVAALPTRPVAIAPPRVPLPAPAAARSVIMPVPIAPAVVTAAVVRPEPAPPVMAAAAARGAPVAPTVRAVASALGMARAMVVPPARVTPANATTSAGAMR